MTPLLVLASAHELYLRNQRELDGAVSVLLPFWSAALAAVVAGCVLAALSDRSWARTALWAYHAAGAVFLAYSLLRALPWGGHLAGWALDQGAAVAVLLLAYVVLVAVLARRDVALIGVPLALFGVVLLGQEAWRMGSRLLPSRPAPEAGAPSIEATSASLPNVYHLVLDGFQPDLFDLAWPADAPLDGFVYFRETRSLFPATVPSMMSVFASRRPDVAGARGLEGALAGEASLLRALRGAGYRSVAFLPPGIYPQSTAFDAIVWHADRLPAAEAAALHRVLFLRLWLANALPASLVDRLAGGNVFGFGAEEMRSLRNQRVSVLTQPVTTVLSFERYLEHEQDLPAAGRYTLVHLLVPHNPFVLAPDCSYRDIRGGTDALAQSRCAARLMERFLDRLDHLGRLRGSVVLIHSDHGSNVRFVNGALVPTQGDDAALFLLKPRDASGPLRRTGEAASLLDVTPTLLRCLGLPGGPLHQGRALPESGCAAD